ncbi:MAG TPA: GNAT family N-acetyltransferase [Candidatus Limnocylindrales bacterium]|nr:GNAT family N-acetyltransferase [Candidatus Limnocylindrales bacterium]
MTDLPTTDGADERPAGDLDIRDAPERRRYEASSDGTVAGFLAYRPSPDGLRLVHTQVDPAFEGHGIGGRLARFALDRARASGERVVVECPFVRSWLRRHREYDDDVAPRS